MSEHFFVISRKKNKAIYQVLVLLNIFCTLGIIGLTSVLLRKDFTREKTYVVEQLLEVDSMAQLKSIADLSSLYTFFTSTTAVN